MKKNISSLVSVGLLSLLATNATYAAENHSITSTSSDTSTQINTQSDNLLVPYEAIKDQYEAQNVELNKSDIPTIKEFNEKISKELNVSNTNPTQTIDLGNGFTVEASASISDNTFDTMFSKYPSLKAATATIYNKTAKGSFTVKTLGVDQYRIKISVPFSYTGSSITSYSKTPSASAEAWLGWSGSIKGTPYVYSIDSTAKDAIADGEFKYIKLIGNYAGHIEVRFTGTGNYYMHDTFIGSSIY